MGQIGVAFRERDGELAGGIYFSGEQIRQRLCAADSGIPGFHYARHLVDPGHCGRAAGFENYNRFRIGGSDGLDKLVLVLAKIQRVRLPARAHSRATATPLMPPPMTTTWKCCPSTDGRGLKVKRMYLKLMSKRLKIKE